MIPNYSFIGAAISTVLSDILILALSAYVIFKLDYKVNKKLYVNVGKIILGSLILGIVLYLLNLNMWVAIPVAILIYLVLMILLRILDDDDKYVIKEILGRN